MYIRRRDSGFTLIELLVVIAIIAILASILFPVFASAKERARMVKCMSNLRQLAYAMRIYADDNDGRLPSAGIYMGTPDWCGCTGVGAPVYPQIGTIWAYTKKSKGIFICPTDSMVKAKQVSQYPYPLSYSMNMTCDIARVDGLPNKLSKLLLLIHEQRSTINDGLFYWGGNDYDIPSEIHYDGTTLVYVDGHAKWANAKSLYKERDDVQHWWNTGLPLRR